MKKVALVFVVAVLVPSLVLSTNGFIAPNCGRDKAIRKFSTRFAIARIQPAVVK